MNFVMALLAGDPLNPDPTASPDPANVFHSPGIVGFLGTFIMVIGAVALIFSMVSRIRKVSYKAQIQERIAAEKAGTATAPEGEPAEVTEKPAAKRERPAPPAKPKR